MITVQVERWLDVWKEASPLWIPHYDEVGQNKEKMKLNPNIEKYSQIDAAGKFHIVTVRKDGKLVGYHAGVVDTLLHYKDVLVNSSDLYWLDPACRGSAGIGLRLFKEVERSSKARGVKVLYDATKLYLDHDKFFQHLGYTPIERRYSKWIGD